jgi:hypothetical protein
LSQGQLARRREKMQKFPIKHQKFFPRSSDCPARQVRSAPAGEPGGKSRNWRTPGSKQLEKSDSNRLFCRVRSSGTHPTRLTDKTYMSLNLILIIAALIVSWLVFTALLNLLKTTLKTAFSIAAIVLVLQLVFGIGPQQLWQQIIELPQTFLQPASGK